MCLVQPSLNREGFLFIPENFQHALRSLLLGIDPVHQFSILISFKDDVFGRWDQAVFDAAIAADLILVGAGMKKTDIEWFAIFYFGQKDFIDVLFRIIVIMAVAGDASQCHPLVFAVPFIDR